MNKQVDLPIRFTAKQMQAWQAMHDSAIKELLYGGAKGGGKTIFGCFWSFCRACEIINEYNLSPREYPIPVGFMGRKQSVDFTKTTLETWKRYIPSDAYVIKSQEKEIIIAGAVKIEFGGLDSTEVVNKFNSAEYAFFFIDQAEEVTLDDIGELRGTGRLIIDPARGIIPRKGLFTANPRQCWLKDVFVLGDNPSQRFIQALPSDNWFLGPEYVETLKESFGHRPELLEAYLYGSWESLEGADQLIKEAWIRHAAEVTFHESPRKVIAVDVARFGDDQTVINYGEGTEIIEQEIYGKRDTRYTTHRVFLMSRKHDNCPIVVDADGMGVVDGLRELGADARSIYSASTKNIPDNYYNLRAYMWDEAGKMFADKAVQLHNCSAELRKQLCAPTYKFRGNKILVEPKAEIKKKLRRSPDEADAYVMQLYALRFVKSEHEKNMRKDRWEERAERIPAMAM